jgi:hypothetical protein
LWSKVIWRHYLEPVFTVFENACNAW